MKIIDIVNSDLTDKNSTWSGPVFYHQHTLDMVQKVLDRHGLEIILGMQENVASKAFIDIIPKPVSADSSMLDNFSYDETTKKLLLVFKSGVQYEYFDVEKGIFLALKEADSKGKFFHKHIKSKYRCKQID